jgi:hypothetical protein
MFHNGLQMITEEVLHIHMVDALFFMMAEMLFNLPSRK